MIPIYMIFTALATAALAKGSIECNFSEPTGARQCFGAVGQPLIFHLPTTGNTEVQLVKDSKYMILKIKNKIVTLHEEYVNRSELLTNGTFKLGNAMKRHSGDYQLEQFGSNGALLKKVNVHLEIQAPVSKPAVSQMCLSPEQMNISCSSEGDAVEYILTLDGHSLTLSSCSIVCTDKQHKPSVAISLHGQLTGNFMCNVRNNVSREETVIRLTSCSSAGLISHSSHVTVAVMASVATLLLLLALLLGIKHLNKKTRPMTVHQDNAEDKIVYSDVRVVKYTRKTRPNSHENAA